MIQNIYEKYTKGELNVIDGNNKLCFSCEQCGRCCKNRNDILMNPADVFRASKFLNITTKAFIDKYCEVYIGDTSRLPVVTVKFKELDSYTFCPFLRTSGGVGRCTIQMAKPFVCAAYPMGRLSTIDPETQEVKVKYFNNEVSCGGRDSEFTLEEWFSQYNIANSEQCSTIFSNFIVDLYKIIKMEEFYNTDKLSNHNKNLFYSMYMQKLYLDLDVNSDIEKQLVYNIEELKASIVVFVAYFSKFADIAGVGIG